MFEEISEWLKQFFGQPQMPLKESVDLGLDDSLLAQAIRCESVHFLSSAVLGWLVFLLTWTILSEKKLEWSEVYIFRCSFLFGLCASLTIHILIDGFTTIA